VKVSLASRLTRASGNHHRSLSGTKVAILAKNSLRDQSDVPLIHASEDIIEKNNIVFRVDCPRKRLEDDAGVSNASSSALMQEPKGNDLQRAAFVPRSKLYRCFPPHGIRRED